MRFWNGLALLLLSLTACSPVNTPTPTQPAATITPSQPTLTPTPDFVTRYQAFERGFMVGFTQATCAYVYSSEIPNMLVDPRPVEGRYSEYGYCTEYGHLDETTLTTTPPQGLLFPADPFARLWAAYPQVQEALGFATAPVQTYSTGELPAYVQPYSGGPFYTPFIMLPDGQLLWCGTRSAVAGSCVIQREASF